MSFGKLTGRIAFALGFFAAMLFYAVPLTYERRAICPFCPFIDRFPPVTWMDNLQLGLTIGLLQGFFFALVGFAVGYLMKKVWDSLQL